MTQATILPTEQQVTEFQESLNLTALAWTDAKNGNVMSYPDNEEYVTEYKEAFKLLYFI